MNFLSENELDLWKHYENEIEDIKNRIDERIVEIYDSIYKLFDVKNTSRYKMTISLEDNNSCYELCGRCNGTYGLNDLHDFIRLECNRYNYPKAMNIYYDSKELNNNTLNLTLFFPKVWLFNDFQEELNDGYNKYKTKIDAAQAKAAVTKAQSKEDKIKLQELIKSKLSAEELELISFKKK